MQSPVRHKKCRPARGSGATSGKTAKQQNRKSRPKATRRNAGVLFGRQAAATQPAARFCQILRQSFLVRTPQKARLFPAAFAARLLAVSCPAAARRPPFARRAALGRRIFRYFDIFVHAVKADRRLAFLFQAIRPNLWQKAQKLA